MYRAFTKTLALVVFTAAALTACKKDKEESLAVTKENLAATYTLSTVTIKATGVPETDITKDYVEACAKDDQMILKSDGSYQHKDLGTTCDPKGDETGTFTISGSTLSFIVDQDTEQFTVKSLSNKKLVVEETGEWGGTTVTFTTTFSR
jgi:lipocalin-like protein